MEYIYGSIRIGFDNEFLLKLAPTCCPKAIQHLNSKSSLNGNVIFNGQQVVNFSIVFSFLNFCSIPDTT
jgi:hypothetical protein